MGVGESGSLPAGDDGVERGFFRAQDFHLIFKFRGDIDFADSGTGAADG